MSEEEEQEVQLARERIPSEVDFDAIFMSVALDQVRLLLSFSKLFDAENAWILTGSELNIKENQLLEDSSTLRFIDAYPISDQNTYLQDFFEKHWKHFNYRENYQAPGNYTIYAYESLQILMSRLSSPLYHNRESLREGLQSIQGLPVLTGNVHVTESGEMVKELKILKIKNGRTLNVFAENLE